MYSMYEDLQKRLSPKRFTHSLGVAKTAVLLARQYGVDEETAYIAGLAHDCAKELPLPIMQQVVNEAGLLIDPYMLASTALLHGAAGAVVAANRYGIDDEDILEAIRVHTTGKVGMTALEKIIFLADYIEPSRTYPAVTAIREATKEGLNQGVLAGYNSTISLLIRQNSSIYFKTVLGRNDILQEIMDGR